MKKTAISAICAFTLLSASQAAFAAEPILIAKPPVTQVKQNNQSQYKVIINGTKLDAGSLHAYKKGNVIMVPLRVTASSLNFKVQLGDKKGTVVLDNGSVKTTLTIGTDNYYVQSSRAIGMSAPTKLGAAPTTVKGSVYVPVEIYNILFSNPKTVNVTQKTITINTPNTPQEENVQIPNPLVEFKTLQAAEKSVGFATYAPSTLTDEYKQDLIQVISNSVVEVFYSNGKNTIRYRVAKGSEDISGNYEVYSQVSKKDINDIHVTIKGNNNVVNQAIWTQNNKSYSLYLESGVSIETLEKMLKLLSV
ncbi:stalk domain-containing protein [Paenibacillus peoriae]|uniref:stalk domain-containing protein n=1 Tax=Paenibacillus peoriae TaxID=59893 RepID=UPI00026C6830|nr:stalk domain-containing protein [Paenibacillus peoriae]MEC0180320.1 stalk domain-containing protein [Paenibacillus peoriae]